MWKKQPTSKETARDSRRDIGHATRDLDKEIASMQNEEKKLVQEIKAAGKVGNEAGVRMLAKHLIRARGNVTRLTASKAQLRGISTHVAAAQSQAVVANAVGKAGNVMKQANAQMDPIKTAGIAMDFQKESAKMDLAGEVMDDALSGVLDDGDIEDESDALTAQVLESLGVEASTQLASAPRAKVRGAEAQGSSALGFSTADDSDLEKRFAKLLNS